MPRIRELALSAMLAAGLALGAAPVALAQTAPPPAAIPEAQSFSDAELETFAVAYLDVQQVGTEWGPRIQGAPSPEEAARLEQEALAEMIERVEAQGLSVDQYNAILQSAQIDPELQQRVVEKINEAEAQ
jgi:hypothetical protein